MHKFTTQRERCRTSLCNAPFFAFTVEEKAISIRKLKADACLFGELSFDVNSVYFHSHGGYEYARQFYADAYQAAVDIVGTVRETIMQGQQQRLHLIGRN